MIRDTVNEARRSPENVAPYLRHPQNFIAKNLEFAYSEISVNSARALVPISRTCRRTFALMARKNTWAKLHDPGRKIAPDGVSNTDTAELRTGLEFGRIAQSNR